MDPIILTTLLFLISLYLYIGGYLLDKRIFAPDGVTLQILFLLFWLFFILIIIAFTLFMFFIACLCDMPRIFHSPEK